MKSNDFKRWIIIGVIALIGLVAVAALRNYYFAPPDPYQQHAPPPDANAKPVKINPNKVRPGGSHPTQ